MNTNYSTIKQEIDSLCKKIERNPEEITLIAVSKTKPVMAIQEIYDMGCRDFGENKVQEIIEKYEQLPKDIKWHMIGHLQTNKVKYIIDKVEYIHSVDSYRLGEEINRQAIKHNKTIKILLEVNVAEEESKFGYSKDTLWNEIIELAKLPKIKICRLMTVAPYTENEESNRKYFKAIKDLSVDITKKNIDNVNMDVLSMGMSGDYKCAIEEEATMIRVGTSIFGDRIYPTK